jgi:DNA-binding transcriptional LysR family regulator
MNTKWAEDFLALVETRSFGRAATVRNSSPAAFSRRIQSLETWVGAELVDRSSSPLVLTAAGHSFRYIAVNIISQVNLAKNIVSPIRQQSGTRHLA